MTSKVVVVKKEEKMKASVRGSETVHECGTFGWYWSSTPRLFFLALIKGKQAAILRQRLSPCP
ncbi:hypothetical protein HNR44_003228 [Geomicrobium halophilum]|uniref:Uncharacterized protein n=1 Tax=Geomicrobium halophilum TaxID=549000 RepID=A0A841PTY4_9BACL|nr:hypothetical protein [Geomicrobium halophilum]